MSKPKGVSLLEFVIVMLVIALFVGFIFVAVDPIRRLHEARNARRYANIATVLDALKKYQSDREGSHFPALEFLKDDLFYQIGASVSDCAIPCGKTKTQPACLDLGLLGKKYLPEIPKDPQFGSEDSTRYAIQKNADGILTLMACKTEGDGPYGGGAPPLLQIRR